MPSEPEIRILHTPQDLFQAAASEFATRTAAAISDRGKFTVALSGGSTPKSLYSVLAKAALPWEKIFFFWGDERHVPPDHPDSNYRMASEALLSKVSVPPGNIFRIRAEEKDADVAAQDYEQTLRSFFHLRPGEFPRFDLILLGLGPDGHTASLFPETAALGETKRLVVAIWVEKLKTHRITFTYPVLNHAACVMFLVSGGDKAEMVCTVLEDRNANLPSQKVQPVNGKLLWLLDQGAAGKLSKK
ncbi:MAG: 6-phosphogluconolactonase [Acidobacteria bacterium]|nr:MAG: 6-phosphogluconolactonase [Acidobacteriota bacterium]